MKRLSLSRSVMLTAFVLLPLLGIFAQETSSVILGHRGGRNEQDENTLQAFQNAWNAGIHSFETDVHMTKDGALIIIHDSSLKRTCGVEGNVEEMTVAELRKIRSLKGNPLLFLNELLDFFHDKKGVYVEFEMKTSDKKLNPDVRIPVYCEKAAQAIKAKMPADAYWSMTSFDYRPLRYLHEHYPQIRLMLISGTPCNDQTIETARALGVQGLAVTLDGTTRAAMKKAHDAGLKVNLWPGKKVEDTLLAYYLGADFLCTDIPIETKKYFDKMVPQAKVKFGAP